MKKYKLLKPLPGYPVGHIFEQDSWGNISFITSVDAVVFPEFFEEVEEPSDEELLAEWISIQYMQAQDIELGGKKALDKFLAKKLISKGFDVSKLREGK